MDCATIVDHYVWHAESVILLKAVCTDKVRSRLALIKLKVSKLRVGVKQKEMDRSLPLHFL